MEIPFRKIELSDKKWVDELLAISDYRGAEYTFSNNFNWSNVYEIDIAKCGEFLLYLMGRSDRSSYLFPAGRGDLKAVVLKLIEDAKSRNHEFRLHGIQKEQIAVLEELFPGEFEFETSEGAADYIYTVEKLSTLSGKKLHAKRNHINRFIENFPDWKYEEINAGNIDEVRAMNDEWCKQNDIASNPSLASEFLTVKSSLDNFDALELRGGLIRAGGKVIAFSLGHAINSDTFGVHIEKAFSDIQGAYPMINQQFVIHEMKDFTYVNREEDMGDEGLRHAKRSYYPEFMYERYRAKLKK